MENNIKELKTLEELLLEIKKAVIAKDKAERARVNAEFQKTKARYEYSSLIQMLQNNEYTI